MVGAPPPPHTADAPRVAAVAHPLVHFFAGWFGASISCVLLSPLEVIKTRQQSALSAGSHAVRADALAVSIMRAEGVRGFYRGLGSHLLGVGPSRAFYFGGYALVKQRLGDGGTLSGAPLHLIAASVSTIFSATVMSPVWVVKTRLQLAGGAGARKYAGVADAFRTVLREEGIRAFYRGLSASYLGVFETSLQFVLYGALKDRVRADRRTAGLADEYPSSVAFWASAAAKLAAAMATYPHEVLRTRMREPAATIGGTPRYTGVVQSVKLIIKEEGVRGLYGGLGVHLLRTVPNAAILLMVVERLTGGGL